MSDQIVPVKINNNSSHRTIMLQDFKKLTNSEQQSWATKGATKMFPQPQSNLGIRSILRQMPTLQPAIQENPSHQGDTYGVTESQSDDEAEDNSPSITIHLDASLSDYMKLTNLIKMLFSNVKLLIN